MASALRGAGYVCRVRVYQLGCDVGYYPDGCVWQEDARGDGEAVSGYGVGVELLLDTRD